MFTSLGLFSCIPCPVAGCQLPGCLFQHPQKKDYVERPAKRRKIDEASHSGPKLEIKRDGHVDLSTDDPIGARSDETLCKKDVVVDPLSEHKDKSSGLSGSSLHVESLGSSTSKGVQLSKSKHGVESGQSGNESVNDPPESVKLNKERVVPKSDPRYISRAVDSGQISIKFDPSCNVPHESRLHYLRLYKAQFERIYAAFDNEIFQKLVTDHAIEQEKSVVSKNGKGTYKQASRNALVALNKRELARDDTDVGIHPTYKPPKRNLVDWSSLVHTAKTLHTWGYTTRIPDPDTSIKNEEGCDRICDRCTQRFIVTEDHARWITCTYHPGKSTYKNEGGARVTTWTCCGSNSGEGCTTASSHVFKINHAPRLAAYCPYTILTESDSQRSDELDVVALDCEMVYTTASMELARICITSKVGEVILDRYVAPENCILDLNTRYSGITQKSLTEHAISRSSLFHEFARLGITKNTIMIGHGLENDLTALRIVHLKVIDSAIIFPHPRGRPYRNGLKYLTKRYLNKDIQVNTVTKDGTPLGHDPAEDARSALELILWKVEHGKEKVGDEPFMGKLK